QDNWQQYFKRKKAAANSLDEVHGNKKKYMQTFLNQLLPFQFIWATSTLSYKSYTDNTHTKDETLKFFLQRCPDIYLLLYYPLIYIRNTSIDGEIVLISPIGIDISYVIQKIKNGNIVVNNEGLWQVESADNKQIIISPLISLKRTE